MKFWKQTLLSAVSFLSISSTVLYTACVKDSCDELKCKNQSVCTDGYCRCKPGFEGAECQTAVYYKFAGKYDGTTSCGNSTAPYADSAVVALDLYPDVISMILYSKGEEKYVGTIEGNAVNYKDGDDSFNMVVDNDKLTVYIEETIDGKKNVCRFIGNKRKY